MAQPERQRLPLLLRPDRIEEVNRMGAHLRAPEGQAEIAAWAKRLREDPRLREDRIGAWIGQLDANTQRRVDRMLLLFLGRA